MSHMFLPAPEPKTELGRYRILANTAGVRVSPLVLGAMSMGEAWAHFMGSVDKEQSFKLLDAFADAGGNFIDTASNYQNEESETYIGEWMTARDNRDQIFVATKYTTQYRAHKLGVGGKVVNYSGNSKKNMFVSVRESLRKLQTTYIDLLYVHYWDWTTSIEEMMDSLHILIEQGKVLYLGISDTPAWIVAAANTYARDHGKTTFSVYSGEWNIMSRDFERDIIPMARHFGMALSPWGVVGAGRFQSEGQLEARKNSNERVRQGVTTAGPTSELTDAEKRSSKALGKVAGEHGPGATVQQIALAYVMQKTRSVFPIVGGRKVEHLMDNIKALSIHLTDDQVQYLEEANEFDMGFPMKMFEDDPRETGKVAALMASTAPMAFYRAPKAIGRE